VRRSDLQRTAAHRRIPRACKLRRRQAQIGSRSLLDSLDLCPKDIEAGISGISVLNELRTPSPGKNNNKNDPIEIPIEIDTSSKKEKRRTRRQKEKLSRAPANASVFIESNSRHETEASENGSPSQGSLTRSTLCNQKEKMAHSRTDSGVSVGTNLDSEQLQFGNNEEPCPQALNRKLSMRHDDEYMGCVDNNHWNKKAKFSKVLIEDVKDAHPQKGILFSFCGI